jgi:hypothetical protein
MQNGPFQITRHTAYTAYVGDPVHRFFRMRRQFNGDKRELFVWVDETSGGVSRNRSNPANPCLHANPPAIGDLMPLFAF